MRELIFAYLSTRAEFAKPKSCRRKLVGPMRAYLWRHGAAQDGQWPDAPPHALALIAERADAGAMLADFCARVGTRELFRPVERTTFLSPEGRLSTLAAGPWPAPLHLAGSFLRANYLTVSERLRVAYGMACLRFAGVPVSTITGCSPRITIELMKTKSGAPVASCTWCRMKVSLAISVGSTRMVGSSGGNGIESSSR